MEERKRINTKIIEEVIGSYELKVKTISSLIKQVIQKIKSFQNEQIQLAKDLQDNLAKTQNLRRKDFDSMIANIRIQNSKREQEVTQMVEGFCKEEEENITELRAMLSGIRPGIQEDFEVIKTRMLNRPKEREQQLTRMLKNFHRDQEELTLALKKLLKKGPSIKIKDLKTMIKVIHIAHQEECSQIDEILDDFDRVKDEISGQWHEVMTATSNQAYRVPYAKA